MRVEKQDRRRNCGNCVTILLPVLVLFLPSVISRKGELDLFYNYKNYFLLETINVYHSYLTRRQGRIEHPY